MSKQSIPTASMLYLPHGLRVASLVGALLIALPAAATHVYLKPAAAPAQQQEEGRPDKGHVKPVAGLRPAQGERVEAATLVLTPGGFEPEEVTLPEGKVLLALKKRVGERDVVFKIEREEKGGPPPRLIRTPKETLSWTEIVELRPGSYIISSDDPEQTCRITVTTR